MKDKRFVDSQFPYIFLNFTSLWNKVTYPILWKTGFYQEASINQFPHFSFVH